jgi:hypothetical protein
MKVNSYLIYLLLLILSNKTNAQNLPDYVSKDSLVGWWPFNGNANDESGKNNHGKINEAELNEDRFGMANKAYKINGPAPGISVDNIKIQSHDFTLSYWVKYNSKPTTKIISDISHDWYKLGSFHVYRDSNNNIVFATPHAFPDWERYSKKSGNDSMEPLNQWINIVIVRSGPIMSLYKNGQEVSSIINGNSLGFITQNLYFGGDPTNFELDSNAKFNGILDDIGLWNRSLTHQEVIDLYSSCNLTILEQPENQFTELLGTAKFSVLVSDTNTTYKWQAYYKNMGTGEFEDIGTSDPYLVGVNTPVLTVKLAVDDYDKMKIRCLLNLNPCVDTTQVVELNFKSTTKVNTYLKRKLSIYPNPASQLITLNSSNCIGQSFLIYDYQGKCQQLGVIESDEMILKVNNLTEGIYWICVGDSKIKSAFIVKY